MCLSRSKPEVTVKHKDIPLNERIIFALDVDSSAKAEEWVRRLEGRIRFYKVGLQLFLAGWFSIVDWITARGHKVMLDLKLFDVPETVKLALRQIRNHEVTFTTVHGNDPILKAAIAEKSRLGILAVTVLTSFGEEDMKDTVGAPVRIDDLVLSRARSAINLGCDGVVASGLEAARLRNDLGDHFLIVTPGIRPGGNVRIPADDQKRIVTAGNAVACGADHVVVGRPISTAEDPLAVVESMQKEIQKVLG